MEIYLIAFLGLAAAFIGGASVWFLPRKAAERIFEVGKDISGLQDILRAPKLRAVLGELFLGDLLGQCLPSTHFELQYAFRDGSRVDAVIKLSNGLVPVDAKFPLENFKKTLGGGSVEEKKAARKRFLGDCKKHIDAIAGSYIQPSQGTFNFALMYIPAENVYYETVIRDTEFGDELYLAGYAFSKRVIPVSPNCFYAYLQTILLGLRGMEVGERAESILAGIETLKNEFKKFGAEFDILGKHINNSRVKYDEAARKLDRVSDKFATLEKGPGEDIFQETTDKEQLT